MKRAIFFVFLLLALAGAWWYYFQASPRGTITLTGIVTTDDVIVSAQVQGRLQELRVAQGDVVKKGEVLALIQPGQWLADMSFYQNSQKQAATQVSQAQADLRFQESQTRYQVAQAQANLAAAQAQETQAKADMEYARLTLEREEKIYKQGAETVQSYDQARTSYDAQKARVDALNKQVAAAEAALALAKSTQEQVSVRQATVDMNEHQLAAAEAQMDKAKIQLGYTEIDSPMDGIVDVRAALQGEVVNPAQPIVTLINPDDLWVRVDVEETYIDRVHLGDKLPVKLPSGTVREGTVFFRGVDADYATQRDVSRTKRDIKTFEVRLRCDNKDRALAVGLTAYVTLPLTLEPATQKAP